MQYKVGDIIRISPTNTTITSAKYKGYVHEVIKVLDVGIKTRIIKVLEDGKDFALNMTFQLSYDELIESVKYQPHIHTKVLTC